MRKLANSLPASLGREQIARSATAESTVVTKPVQPASCQYVAPIFDIADFGLVVWWATAASSRIEERILRITAVSTTAPIDFPPHRPSLARHPHTGGLDGQR